MNTKEAIEFINDLKNNLISNKDEEIGCDKVIKLLQRDKKFEARRQITMKNKYKVYYRLINDYDMIVKAKDEEDAREIVIDKANPNNKYDWITITGINKLKEVKNE